MWVSLSRYKFGASVAFLQSEEEHMRYWKFLALPTLIAAWLSIPSSAPAQVSINIGAEPVCPYGYYDAAPYNCAPYGYYGPEWFSGGVFIGAGPWFHGPRDFNGHVDTASIHVTATLVHIPTVVTRPLITSTETRCVMDAATQGVEAAARNSVSGTAQQLLLTGVGKRVFLFEGWLSSCDAAPHR